MNLAAIQVTGVTPGLDPNGDKFKEFLDLTPASRREHEHASLIVRLDAHIEVVRKERDEHKAEVLARHEMCDTLRAQLHQKELEIVRLTATSYGDRWFDIGITVSGLIGACLISSFAKGSGWFAFGWAIVGIAAALQIGRSALSAFIEQRTQSGLSNPPS